MPRRKNPYPGVSRTTDRHGKVRWRFFGKGFSTYLPGEYGSEEFVRAYHAARSASQGTVEPRAQRGTIAHLIESYLSSPAYKDLADITRKTKGGRLNWIREQAGDLPYARLEARHVEALMSRKEGASAANRVRKDLIGLYTYATKRHGYTGPNPASLADARKERSDGYHTWTDEEIAAYLDRYPSGTVQRRAMLLMLTAGASRQDAARMTRDHLHGDRIVFARGKTGELADLPIMSDLAAELAHVPAHHRHLLSHGDDKPYTVNGLGERMRQWCRDAGLPHCTAHGLRKAGATRLALAGASESEIASYLAHRDTKEASTYTRAASRRLLADRGLGRLSSLQPKVPVSPTDP